MKNILAVTHVKARNRNGANQKESRLGFFHSRQKFMQTKPQNSSHDAYFSFLRKYLNYKPHVSQV